jgi:hypothetical protein
MVHFHNTTVHRGKQSSPHQLFTGQEAPWNLNDFRVFECPVYVLQKRLQDGDHFSKWKARSWQGVYIGPSSHNASSIPLIYNPSNTHVSPQFYLVYDEGLTMIMDLAPDIHNALLNKLYAKAYWSHFSDSINDSSEQHYFDSFWTKPEVSPKPESEVGNKLIILPFILSYIHNQTCT